MTTRRTCSTTGHRQRNMHVDKNDYNRNHCDRLCQSRISRQQNEICSPPFMQFHLRDTTSNVGMPLTVGATSPLRIRSSFLGGTRVRREEKSLTFLLEPQLSSASNSLREATLSQLDDKIRVAGAVVECVHTIQPSTHVCTIPSHKHCAENEESMKRAE
eukprot:3815405-Rhodomonas_salina.1